MSMLMLAEGKQIQVDNQVLLLTIGEVELNDARLMISLDKLV